MKKAIPIKLAKMIGGVEIKKGSPVKVDKEQFVKAFKSLGIEIEDYAYIEYGELSLSIKWENGDVILVFY